MATQLELHNLDARRVEIKIGPKYGLAVMNDDGQWEISPNIKEHTEAVLKKLKENEVYVIPVPSETPNPEPVKSEKKEKKSKGKRNVSSK